MNLNFEKYAQEGNRYLNELAKELGHPEDRDRAARILRAVLNTIRDMVPPSENLQLIAQLPMFLKATYLEGYTLRKASAKPRSLDDFFSEVKKNSGRSADYDFPSEEVVRVAVQKVLSSLMRFVSPGEMEDIVAHMPKGVKQFIAESAMLQRHNLSTE